MSYPSEADREVRRHRITRGELRTFASSIGELRPIHHSVRAARAGGHPDLPVPPTYLFGLTLRTGSPFDWAAERGLDMTRTLHGEQSFAYHAMAYAGDVVDLTSACSPLEQRSGWLRLRRTTDVRRGGALVATLSTTLLCPEAAA